MFKKKHTNLLLALAFGACSYSAMAGVDLSTIATSNATVGVKVPIKLTHTLNGSSDLTTITAQKADAVFARGEVSSTENITKIAMRWTPQATVTVDASDKTVATVINSFGKNPVKLHFVLPTAFLSKNEEWAIAPILGGNSLSYVIQTTADTDKVIEGQYLLSVDTAVYTN